MVSNQQLLRLGTISIVGFLSRPMLAEVHGYTFYMIASLENPDSCYIHSVNNHGVAVGSCTFAGSDLGHAASWSNGRLVDLDVVCGGEFEALSGTAEGINDRMQIVGSGGDAFGNCCAGICENGDPWGFQVGVGCDSNYQAVRINSAGTIAVGSCDREVSSRFRPAVHYVSDGSSIALDLLPGMPPNQSDGQAYDVNDHGVVVGTVYNAVDARAFMWADGVMTEIPNILWGSYMGAYAVNNKGHIFGIATDTSGGDHGYMYHDGVMIDLGEGELTAANERDWGVGSDGVVGDVHAFLFKDGQVIDLHPYLPEGWSFSYARDINDYGWIVGHADYPILTTLGWLLVPIYDKGDYDGDEDVDLHDFGHFQECFAAEPYQGPEGGLHVGCSVFDFDDDVDLDLTDYAAFQSAFTGPITSGW